MNLFDSLICSNRCFRPGILIIFCLWIFITCWSSSGFTYRLFGAFTTCLNRSIGCCQGCTIILFLTRLFFLFIKTLRLLWLPEYHFIYFIFSDLRTIDKADAVENYWKSQKCEEITNHHECTHDKVLNCCQGCHGIWA